MQPSKHAPVHLSRHHLAIIVLSLLAVVGGLGGLALLILNGSQQDAAAQNLGIALWAALAVLALGLGAYGVLLLAGRIHALHWFASARSQAEEGWTALLLAALGGIWLLVVGVWMQPGQHSGFWVLVWLLASFSLGFTSTRRLLVRALIHFFGPREAKVSE